MCQLTCTREVPTLLYPMKCVCIQMARPKCHNIAEEGGRNRKRTKTLTRLDHPGHLDHPDHPDHPWPSWPSWLSWLSWPSWPPWPSWLSWPSWLTILTTLTILCWPSSIMATLTMMAILTIPTILTILTTLSNEKIGAPETSRQHQGRGGTKRAPLGLPNSSSRRALSPFVACIHGSCMSSCSVLNLMI